MTLKTAKIVVTLEDWGDSGIRVSSRDVPGLFLSGEKGKIWRMTGPAIQALLKSNRGMDVVKVWYPSVTPDGDSPRDVPMNVDHEVQFMVELEFA